jgi:alcohol dehydrogenase class IV
MTARHHVLRLPAHTEWGEGVLARVGELVVSLGAGRVFVVSDAGVAAAGHLERLVASLPSRMAAVVHDRVEPEPTVAVVEEAAGALAAAASDVVVSLGGGSVIDTAKNAIVLALNGGDLSEYEDGADPMRPIDRVVPHLAIPTTAGTGSEATAWAVFVDPGRRIKTALLDERLIPAAVLLDPELTVSLPAEVTAGSGMDALSHAAEAYVSQYATPASDALALEAAALAARHLPTAVANGLDLEARMGMLLASFLAGAAFSNSSCGLVHTLSEALGGFYRLPHGATNGVLLPTVMAFNAPSCAERYGRLAEAMAAGAGAPAAIAATHSLRDQIGLPGSLDELGVPGHELSAVADAAYEWANEAGNPREIARDELEALLRRAYGPRKEDA